MHDSSVDPGTTSPLPTEPTRHVRVRLSDSLYRELRHLVVDAGPDGSMSELIADLIERGLREKANGR